MQRKVSGILIVIAIGLLLGACRSGGQNNNMKGETVDIITTIDKDAEHPNLLFSIEDVPVLREKIKTGIAGGAFDVLKTTASSFLGTGTTKYQFQDAIAGRAFTTQVLELAMTGYLTGDEVYIKKAIDILCAAAEQSDVNDFVRFNGALAVGDVAHGYAVGYDWLAPFMTDKQRELVKGEIESFGTWLYENSYTEPWGHDERRRYAWNWNGVTHGALGLCALVLGDKEEWLDRAIERGRGYFEYSKDATGVSYEGITYMAYGMQNLMPMVAALERRGGPDLLAEAPSARHVPNYVLWQAVPKGGKVVQINQSGPNLKPSGGVLYIINKFQDAVGLWGWLKLLGPAGDSSFGRDGWLGSGTSLPYVILWSDPDLRPVSPVEAGLGLSAFFERGQVSIRDGWESLDSLVTFTSGEGIQGIWNHGDENSFTFYTLGEEFAIDPGPGKGATSDHNAIVIEGVGQGTDGGATAVQGKIVRAEDRGDAVYVMGDAFQAYARRQPILSATRQLLFGRGPQPYLLIVDDIQRDYGAHDFSWLLHSGVGNQIIIDSDSNQARIIGKERGAVCYVKFLWPSDVSFSGSSIIPTSDNPKLIATARAVNPHFVTLLVAVDKGEQPPAVTYDGTPENMRIEIEFHDGTKDILSVSRENIEFLRIPSQR